MSKIGRTENLLIDMRVNPGGNDETALFIASYFFKEKEIAFIKKVRNGPNYEDFSLPDTTYVFPKEGSPVDIDKIYLLTNGASGSSADAFALVMSQLDEVTIVGTNTEGIFSNMYRDTLSNGWRITLSNERYYSKEMKCYESIGVPVDIRLENKSTDVMEGKDVLIDRIREIRDKR